MAGIVHRWIAFLDEHRLFRRWIVPVVFMALLLFPFFLINWTPHQSAQLVAVFLVASLAISLSGMGVQLAIERYVARKRER